MQVATDSPIFWLALIVVGIAVLMLQRKFRLAAKNPFRTRPLVSPREQLVAHGLEAIFIDDAIRIWNELASAYQFDPAQLRADDKVADLVGSDWFGDKGLSFEAKLTALGVKALPADTTILDLVQLLAGQERSPRP